MRGLRKKKGGTLGFHSFLHTLLFDVESLAGVRPLGHGLAEHGHEVLIVILGPAREFAQVVGAAELHGGLLRVFDNLFKPPPVAVPRRPQVVSLLAISLRASWPSLFISHVMKRK